MIVCDHPNFSFDDRGRRMNEQDPRVNPQSLEFLFAQTMKPENETHFRWERFHVCKITLGSMVSDCPIRNPWNHKLKTLRENTCATSYLRLKRGHAVGWKYLSRNQYGNELLKFSCRYHCLSVSFLTTCL